MIRIGIAAPNLPLRLGLRSLLTDEDFLLVGEFATLENAAAAELDLLVLVASSVDEIDALDASRLPPIPKENRDAALQQYTDEIMCQIAA
ncbi:MAG: hypothetical protein NT121_26195, partial [Chloroflexi bacterium]|nr:hypothetical protein [Chloroflexota bacterium]